MAYYTNKITRFYRNNNLLSIIQKGIGRFKSLIYRKIFSTSFDEKEWKSIKNKYFGKKVFLVGNGPSLNKTPLYLLKNEYTMCFNRFYLFLERLNWAPNFYSTTDNLVLNDLLNELDQIVPLTEYSFFPGVHFRGDKFIGKINYENVLFTKQLFGRGVSHALPNIYPGGTTIYEGLQILKFLGFSEIYLIGVDMSYSIHQTAKKKQKKGIDIQSQNDDDPNHFDPRYFGKNRQYHQPEKFVVDNILDDMEYISKNLGECKVYNIGFDSKLKSFPKKDFHDVLVFTKIEKYELFEQCIKSNSIYTGLNELKSHSICYDLIIEEGKNYIVDFQDALELIKKNIFTHIPFGPFEDKYYFVSRNYQIKTKV